MYTKIGCPHSGILVRMYIHALVNSIRYTLSHEPPRRVNQKIHLLRIIDSISLQQKKEYKFCLLQNTEFNFRKFVKNSQKPKKNLILLLFRWSQRIRNFFFRIEFECLLSFRLYVSNGSSFAVFIFIFSYMYMVLFSDGSCHVTRFLLVV